jgi:1-deoxy-D-xylulose-5-phosphate synthase
VGIAEQHAVTLAAGMAAEGMVPYCAIYSTFLQRAYDQLIHDVALQQLPVVFCLDRGGLVGADGATHHGAFDLAYLQLIPNLIVAAPRNETELRNLLFTALQQRELPFAIRYPRGNGNNPDWKQSFKVLPVGRGERLQSGQRATVISIGTMAEQVSTAIADMTDIGHIDIRYVKPLDEMLLRQAAQTPLIITVEDGCLSGGAGAAMGAWLHAYQYRGRFISLGLPDSFIEQGSQEELFGELGLDTAGIRATIQQALL